MKTITIITPSNIEVEYRLAGAPSRLAAYLIDLTVQLLLITFFALTILLGVDRGIFGNRGIPSGESLGVVLVFAFVVQFGYFIFSELTMSGQSIGKRIFGLRVICDNGQPIGFFQSLTRGLLRTSLDMMYVGLFIILFSKKHKRLGDMAAGTIVISEHRPSFLPNPQDLTPEEFRITEEWLSRRDDMTDGGNALREKLVAYFAKRDNSDE
jgi:uncharacterized RDD family membrane protein YckC